MRDCLISKRTHVFDVNKRCRKDFFPPDFTSSTSSLASLNCLYCAKWSSIKYNRDGPISSSYSSFHVSDLHNLMSSGILLDFTFYIGSWLTVSWCTLSGRYYLCVWCPYLESLLSQHYGKHQLVILVSWGCQIVTNHMLNGWWRWHWFERCWLSSHIRKALSTHQAVAGLES